MRLTPQQINALATYNGECARGIVHTEQYDRKMALLQEHFNTQALEEPESLYRPLKQESTLH